MAVQSKLLRQRTFSETLLSASKTGALSKTEIELLLATTDALELELLYEAARKARESYFGTNVFLYGFLYFSTYCRNKCNFCLYSVSNKEMQRYRKSRDEIVALAKHMADCGVHLIDLTMGEDPAIYAKDDGAFQELLHTIKGVVRETGLPVMLSPGAMDDGQLQEVAKAGVSWFACYQEIHDPEHFATLRPGQDYWYRLGRKEKANAEGMHCEEGILLGAGESISNLADSILWMKENPVQQIRAMRFVPPPHSQISPGSNSKYPKGPTEQTVIAVMRLLMPERLIPASLDVDGLEGLRSRLDAGANVITSIIPSQRGLAGVANSSLDIEENKRSPEHVLPIVKACGLRLGSQEEYLNFILRDNASIA